MTFVTIYSVTKAMAGAWFLVRNATTVCAMCHDHRLYGFPFPNIDIGWAVPDRYALYWPGAIVDGALILLPGFILAKGISLLLMVSRRDSARKNSL